MRALGNGQENVSKSSLKYKGFFCNFGVWKFCEGPPAKMHVLFNIY